MWTRGSTTNRPHTKWISTRCYPALECILTSGDYRMGRKRSNQEHKRCRGKASQKLIDKFKRHPNRTLYSVSRKAIPRILVSLRSYMDSPKLLMLEYGFQWIGISEGIHGQRLHTWHHWHLTIGFNYSKAKQNSDFVKTLNIRSTTDTLLKRYVSALTISLV
jgi:hypothetical protein